MNYNTGKKYSLILIFGLSLLLCSSCEKFLNQAPTGEETEDYIFEDYSRALRYMDQLYSSLPEPWSGNFSGVNLASYTRYGFLESATDMAEYTASYGAANVSMNTGNWRKSDASYEISAPWNYSYTALRIAYKSLANMDKYNNEPKSDDGLSRKESMKGEIHYMIAFYYFELLKRYGGVPLVKEVMDLSSDIQIPRASYDETKDYILENLNKSAELVPDQWTISDYGRVTKAMVMALKSRVLLYAASPLNNPKNDVERWKSAAKAARDLIDLAEAHGEISLNKEYGSIFIGSYPENIPEVISPLIGSFAVSFNSYSISYGQATPGDGFRGQGNNSPTQNFVDRFEVLKYDAAGQVIGSEPFDWKNPDHVKNIYKNRDPRFYYTVLYNGVFWIQRQIETWRDGSNYGKDINPKDHLYTRTGYYLRKYWPRACIGYSQAGSSRLTKFTARYAEILLNYAEAMNEAFGPDVDGLGRAGSITARDAVNMVRSRLVCPPSSAIGKNSPYANVKIEREENPDFPVLPQGMPKIAAGLSVDQMRNKIVNERIIELSFEEHYLYDILRWKKGKELMGSPIYGIDVVKSGSTFTYARKKVEDRVFDESRMYLYPIPEKDVYTMRIKQNTGW